MYNPPFSSSTKFLLPYLLPLIILPLHASLHPQLLPTFPTYLLLPIHCPLPPLILIFLLLYMSIIISWHTGSLPALFFLSFFPLVVISLFFGVVVVAAAVSPRLWCGHKMSVYGMATTWQLPSLSATPTMTLDGEKCEVRRDTGRCAKARHREGKQHSITPQLMRSL